MARRNFRFPLFYICMLLSSSLLADAPDAPSIFAKPYAEADLSSVNQTVNDLKSLQELFVYLRDERCLTWDKMPDFKRRIPWLYPQQGCSDRATLMRKLIEERGLTPPTRVFAFSGSGNRLNLRNQFYDEPISWSQYHTALITKVNGQTYVLDPTAEAGRPLTLEEWVTRLGDGRPETVSISICSPLSTSAERSCFEKDPNQAYRLLITQELLEEEWNAVRAVKSGYDYHPKVSLGDSPPWKQPKFEEGLLRHSVSSSDPAAKTHSDLNFPNPSR